MYKYPKLVITCSLLLALHTAFEFELQTVQAVWSGPKFVQSGGLRSLDRTTAIAMTQRTGEKKVFTISQLEQQHNMAAQETQKKGGSGLLYTSFWLFWSDSQLSVYLPCAYHSLALSVLFLTSNWLVWLVKCSLCRLKTSSPSSGNARHIAQRIGMAVESPLAYWGKHNT